MTSKLSDNRLILAIAGPAVMQTIVKSSFTLIDTYWVGKLGSVQLAAITVANFLVWGSFALGELIATGTNSLVAQSYGAQERETGKRIATENLVNAFFTTVLISALFIPILNLLYDIINLDSAQRGFTDDYIVTFLIGMPCVTLLSTTAAVFRGTGDTKTPFYLICLAVSLNFFLAPLLIFGIGGYLQFEVKGAALSTIISYFAAFIAGYIILRKRNLIGKISGYTFDKKILLHTVKIGLPVSLHGMFFSFIYVIVSRFVADYGTTGLAALGIGHRSESISYQICVGLSLAATVLVGQNIGAGNKNRAEKLSWRIYIIGTLAMSVYGLLLFIFARNIAQFFTTDLAVIDAAEAYNKINAVIMIFSAADVILSGAFSGAGDTIPPVTIGLIFNTLRIPLCAVLSPVWGLNGIWIAICASVVLKSIVLTYWFYRGKWKERNFELSEKKENIIELVETE
ncbi:MAG: MATE family efflux transporter [Bacteroidetes bacterium]|nr:MATE family efflux transporter [Bacteroidota bacterium]